MNWLVNHALGAATTGAATTINELFGGSKPGGPDASLAQVEIVILNAIRSGLYFGGLIAILMFVWSAWGYISYYGNDAKIESAKKGMFWAIFGMAITGLAWVIVYFFRTILTK